MGNSVIGHIAVKVLITLYQSSHSLACWWQRRCHKLFSVKPNALMWSL